MQTMTPEEYRQFLLSPVRTGKLATVRADGRPHLTPIWFDLEDDDIYFTTWHTSVKAHNLQRDSRVSLCVDDDQPPFAYIIIEGIVEILKPSPEELVMWAARIAGRYMGSDRAEAFGKRNGVPGELLLRLKPVKILAHKALSD